MENFQNDLKFKNNQREYSENNRESAATEGKKPKLQVRNLKMIVTNKDRCPANPFFFFCLGRLITWKLANSVQQTIPWTRNIMKHNSHKLYNIQLVTIEKDVKPIKQSAAMHRKTFSP